MGREEEENTQTDQMPALWTLQNMGEDMTDQEFNRYCAEVMDCVVHEYDEYTQTIYVHRGDGVIGKRYTDLNQMAEVFDKLVNELLIKCHDPDAPENLLFSQLSLSIVSEGIAQAMREFIESTKGESE